MSEDTSTTETHIDTPAPPPGGSGASLEDLERWKANIRRELEQSRDEARSADQQELEALRKEIAALKEDLEKANQWISSKEKEQADRTQVKGDQSTMVVPPHQLTPPQQVTQTADDSAASARENKKRGLGWW